MPARRTVLTSVRRGPLRSASAPIAKPAMPPSSRFTERAVEMAPRLQPNVSANTGRNTPKAASGVETPKVTVKRAATIHHRRAVGRTLRLLSHLLQRHGQDRLAPNHRGHGHRHKP